jgi:hypothetical protein
MLVVPDATGARAGLSSIVLGAQVNVVRGPVHGDAERPLVFGDRELTPNVTSVFSTAQDLYVYFETAVPANAAISGVPSGEGAETSPVVQVRQGARIVATVEVSSRTVRERHATAYWARLPLIHLDPGTYACRVLIKGRSRAEQASDDVAFEVRN